MGWWTEKPLKSSQKSNLYENTSLSNKYVKVEDFDICFAVIENIGDSISSSISQIWSKISVFDQLDHPLKFSKNEIV